MVFLLRYLFSWRSIIFGLVSSIQEILTFNGKGMANIGLSRQGSKPRAALDNNSLL
jgi:hypothetical protein